MPVFVHTFFSAGEIFASVNSKGVWALFLALKQMHNALFEAFSMMENVNTLDDFDRWARTLILGGKLDVNAP